ncbi:MAG: 3-deoxy-manno-octulosonate cytidylyltransferase [Chloroflexi bacterium]|nr:3-deoxy-manno-octulosonate cytidylyltransferase [Chloroflexota bacterium]
MPKRAIGIIPARMESTRFPGKPLALINGKPMIQHVYDSITESQLITPYYVATDSPEICEACERSGMGYIITASDCRNGMERAADAMRQLSNREDDVVVIVQADEPMIKGWMLDELVGAFNDKSVQIASLMVRPYSRADLDDDNNVKVMADPSDKNALWFNRHSVVGTEERIHVGVYAYRRDTLIHLSKCPPWGPELQQRLEQYRAINEGFNIRMIEVPGRLISVDIPSDIGRVEAALSGAMEVASETQEAGR